MTQSHSHRLSHSAEQFTVVRKTSQHQQLLKTDTEQSRGQLCHYKSITLLHPEYCAGFPKYIIEVEKEQ